MARQETDYDKQYEKDLERAQALSLESLALEQFKNKKRLKDMAKSVINESATTTTKNVVQGGFLLLLLLLLVIVGVFSFDYRN